MANKCRKLILDANLSRIESNSVKLSVYDLLRTISFTAMLVACLAIFLAVVSKLVLAKYGQAQDSLETLVSFRGAIESLLTFTSFVTSHVWAISVAILIFIWIAITKSSHTKKWNNAVSARREALSEALKNQNIDSLKANLGGENVDLVNGLMEKVDSVEEENWRVIQSARTTPVVRLTEDSTDMSLIDLGTLKSQMLEDEDADSSTEEMASGVSALIADIEKQFEVEMIKLDDTIFETTLDVANTSVRPQDSEVREILVETIVEEKLKDHVKEGVNRVGAEPESILEWITSGLVSKEGVKAVSKSGKFSFKLALVTLFFSLIGFNGSIVKANIIPAFQSAELTLVRDGNNEYLDQRIASIPPIVDPETETETETETELADDEATVEFIKATFRATQVSKLLTKNPKTELRQDTQTKNIQG